MTELDSSNSGHNYYENDGNTWQINVYKTDGGYCGEVFLNGNYIGQTDQTSYRSVARGDAISMLEEAISESSVAHCQQGDK